MSLTIARRNISNFRFSDDTTLMIESKELKSLLMKVKEEIEGNGNPLQYSGLENSVDRV